MKGLVLSLFPGIGLLDAEDAELLNGPRWYICNGYARRDIWRQGRKERQYLHRVIMKPTSTQHVDHINGDKLDNRRINLRLVTRSQNLQNRRGATVQSSSGLRGVYTDKRDGAIYARVVVDGKSHNLGRFASITEADSAARQARSALMSHAKESCQ